VSDLESAYIPYLNGQVTQPAPDDGKPHLWGQKGFQFHDLLDAINPLQHLPVVSTVYRWITGDTIGNIPRIVGDAIYGGIPGFVSGLFGVLLKEETGKDVGEHVVATLFGDSKPNPTVPAQNANQPELTTEQAAALTHAPVDAAELAPLTATAAATAQPPAPAGTAAVTAPPSTAGTPPVTSTVKTSAPPATASAPVLPDHAPIPLARGLGMSLGGAPTAASSAITVSKDGATNAFLAQAAERQRQMLGAAAAPPSNGRVLTSHVVPLQLPPGSVSLTRAPATALPAVAPAAGGTPSTGPVDISQKMMDALDKYMALQKQTTAARGAQVDVSVSP
jgi:hypothetical protein